MDSLFKSSSSFASLSLKDLVEARDLFHYHIINKRNVVATALGLYRIRKDDPWPSRDQPNAESKSKAHSPPRTLFNSEVRPYSWPCVYAFVSEWETEADLAEKDPSDLVPKTLYLPDGRSVPVCVIEARRERRSDLMVGVPSGPHNRLAPGAAILNENGQGMTRLATAGCIVRDGQRYYVLTNRHAVGEVGTEIHALIKGRQPAIGVTAQKGLTREDFRTVYPNFASTNQRLLMDVGLIDIDDITRWKTDFPGISPVGPVLDLYDNSYSLQLIGQKVVGRAAVTGHVRGEIQGLFYRYKAMGGSEYVSDFLVGPESFEKLADGTAVPTRMGGAKDAVLEVHHGDSGTVLFIEHVEKVLWKGHDDAFKKTYLPFALLWGKEAFFGGGAAESHGYALATALSPALDRLDLDFVTDLAIDQQYVWGWVGHYIIGRSLGVATDQLRSDKLRSFVKTNLDSLAITPDAALDNNNRASRPGTRDPVFVALADVPDNVWKGNVNVATIPGPGGVTKKVGGPGSRASADNPNHFADLDLPYQGAERFLDLLVAHPDTFLRPKAWVAYFKALEPKFDEWAELLEPGKKDNNKHWGALPFRVHQLFDTMVAAAKAGDQALFLCTGGVLIHYVGDACQPLHASYLSQGDPAQVVKKPKSDGYKLAADGVHSGYEDDMIAYGYQQQGLAAKLATKVTSLHEAVPRITSGYEASQAIVALIRATQDEIAPRAIVDKWTALKGSSGRNEQMWAAFGTDTITCMARGTRYLAAIWQAAWDLGGGDTEIGNGGLVPQADLMKLYLDPDVVPSIPLDHYPDDPVEDWSELKRPEKVA